MHTANTKNMLLEKLKSEIMNSMRAAFYYDINDVRVHEMPAPKIGAGELLVKVYACGICGSDVMAEYRKPKVDASIAGTGRGLVLGHEIAGEVVESNDLRYRQGNRVAVAHHVPCGECDYCWDDHETACDMLHATNVEPGGFAEYIRVPKINAEKGVFLLPDMSYEEATFIEPLGCVVRGQRKIDVRDYDSMLILGSGISGLLHLKLAKAQNPERKVYMTDIDEYRRDAAMSMGADAVLDARENVYEWLHDLNKKGAERVIVCAGAQSAANQAIQCVDRGGAVLYFAGPQKGLALPVDFRIWRGDVTIKTSYAAAPSDMEKSLHLIATEYVNVNDMITHLLPLEETQRGFELTAKPEKSIKVIIQPQKIQ